MSKGEGEAMPKHRVLIAAGLPAVASGDNHVRVPLSCAHGGDEHARCKLDRADRTARGHADQRPCVAGQSAWPEERRPPHPAELAKGLPMTMQGGRWAAVRSALQFAALLERGALGNEPASYVTTGVDNTFELVVSALGRSSTSSLLL